VINSAAGFRVFIATEPVDFRKGMDGLAGYVANTFSLDPYSGAVFVFRSRRADRLKLIVWDGTGLILLTKRLSRKSFVWPKAQGGPLVISKIQFDALFEGIEWRQVVPPRTHKPTFL